LAVAAVCSSSNSGVGGYSTATDGRIGPLAGDRASRDRTGAYRLARSMKQCGGGATSFATNPLMSTSVRVREVTRPGSPTPMSSNDCRARGIRQSIWDNEPNIVLIPTGASGIPSFLRNKRSEHPRGDSGKNRGTGVIVRMLRSRRGDSPLSDDRRVCSPTSIRGLLWLSESASRTRQFTTF
jgi:hypothetical protein